MNRKANIAIGVAAGVALVIGIVVTLVVVYLVHKQRRTTLAFDHPVKFVNFETRKRPYYPLHIKSFQNYANRHGYLYSNFTSFPNPNDLPIYWLKLEFMAAMLERGESAEMVVWVDSDTVVVREHAAMAVHRLFEKHKDKSIFIGRDHPSSKQNVFCAGVFGLRNNETSRAFLKDCLTALTSNPECRDEDGKFIVKGSWGQSNCFEQGVMNSFLRAKHLPYSDALYELDATVVQNSAKTHKDCLILHRFNKKGLASVFEEVGYV